MIAKSLYNVLEHIIKFGQKKITITYDHGVIILLNE